MKFKLNFEMPILELEERIEKLENSNRDFKSEHIDKEIKELGAKTEKLRKQIYTDLSYWDKVQLSRHPDRPHALDYINSIVDDFHELSGDRQFGDDRSMITGFGKIGTEKVAIIAIEKGRKTKEKIERNFGMPYPEGYRKALRIGELASRFKIPIVTLVDTPGAYPGIEAEERGQAHSIAENLEKFFTFECPIVSVVIGEGGSGGALGIAIADKVLMQEYSIYSVISPESCASILWSDPKRAEEAATSLKMDAVKALELKIIDEIINEPLGGAHRDYEKASSDLKKALIKHVKNLKKMKTSELRQKRYERFRNIGNQTIKVLK